MLDVAKLPQSKQGIEEETTILACVCYTVWCDGVWVVGGGRIDVPKCSVKYSLQAPVTAASSSIPSSNIVHDDGSKCTGVLQLLLSIYTYRNWKLRGKYNINEIWYNLKTGVCRLVSTVVHLLVTLLSNQTNSNAYLVSILDIGLHSTSNYMLSRKWASLQDLQTQRPSRLTCSFNIQ